MFKPPLAFEHFFVDGNLSNVWPFLVAVLLLTYLSASYALHSNWKSTVHHLPLPPGPKGIPILGNLLQMLSDTAPWVMYRDWSNQYGDLVFLEVLGQRILVLNSLKATVDLLDRRGSNYADRIVPPSISMVNLGWAMPVMNYGPHLRAHRRLFHQHYAKNQISSYTPVLEGQTMLFLERLLSNPRDFLEESQYLFAAIIIQISYGLNTRSEIQTLIREADILLDVFSDAAEPGFFVVDALPILRFIPSWFPGAAWKRRLLRAALASREIYTRVFDEARHRVESEINHGEFQDVATQLIEKLPPRDHPDFAYQEEVARGTALIAYAGGSDTTSISARALFAALANHPECQRIAQKELDDTVGTDRLPKVSDLPQLPYIQAIIKELSRWHSVSPMVFPHVTKEDDEYNGFFIPKGTAVMGNSWAIMHDPDFFEDPFEFRPERYLTRDPVTQELKINTAVLDPEAAAFGYGRRICPGRHLSNEGLTFMAASLLAVFNVNAPKDTNGKPVKVELKTGNGLLAKPAPFEVEIVPRSARHATLIIRE